jgi:membrane protein YqaA with SNARE-associated domain
MIDAAGVSLLVLFATSFAAATVLPLSSEAVLGVVVARSGGWVVPVLVATVGNTLGACTTYWLGRAARTMTAEPTGRTARAAALLSRYGAPSMLLSWVPIIGDALVALAGAARMPFGRFALWTTLGKCARYIVIGAAIARM